MSNVVELKDDTDFSEERLEEMDERQRIDFIREYAEEHDDEVLQDGIKSIFSPNKYKPKKQHMWKNQLDRGKKLVRSILRRKRREEDG